MEIGSIFEIDPHDVALAKKNTGAPESAELTKYRKAGYALTGSGREAIKLALMSLIQDDPEVSKVCLVPAYMCDTVFIPFLQCDWEIVPYHIGRDMKADADELKALIAKHNPGMIFIHSYYGMDTWKDIRPMLHEYQNSGQIYLMEDMTQNYYTRTPDRDIDYIVGSLRKWYSIPDGGFVLSDMPLHTELLTNDDYFVTKRIEMLTAKWNYLSDLAKSQVANTIEGLGDRKVRFLQLNHDMEEYLDRLDKMTPMSQVGIGLFNMADEMVSYVTRHENYKMLHEALHDVEEIELVFTEYSKDAAPLYFPVYAENRDELQKYLCDSDIYCPVLWPIAKILEDKLSDDERYIYEHILAIPCDHRYGIVQMQRIIDVIMDKYCKIYR